MNEINKITIEINNLSPSQHEGLQKYIATLDADSTMVTIDGHGLVGELLIEEDEIDVCKSGFDCEGCVSMTLRHANMLMDFIKLLRWYH